MAPTIAERAARGEALHAPDLTRQEQGELLVWAREENMGYKEIKTKYGFEQTTDTMRGWHMALVRDRPPKVPTFTDEDDRLLQNAVQLYATGPLNEDKSFKGVWKQVKLYVRKNGGTTSAGEGKLRERWYKLNGQQVPPSTRATRSTTRVRGTQAATPAEPVVTFARSFPSTAGQSQPTSSAQPATGMEWEEYDSLSEHEKIEVLGSDYASEDSPDQEQHEQSEGEDGWGDYPDLSEGEMQETVRSDSLDEDYSGEEVDGDEDSDYEEN